MQIGVVLDEIEEYAAATDAVLSPVCCALSNELRSCGMMRYGRERTLDAKLDEVGVNVRRVTNHIVATVEERRGRALVKQTVFSQPKMFQTIPLGAGLGVL